MKNDPPKLAERFFSWYCKNELHDSILGDLDERYFDEYQTRGPIKAKFRYWMGVIGFINRHTLKRQPRVTKHNNSFSLFLGHIIGYLRFLKRNLGFTAINVFGLTSGLMSLLIILFFLQHELSFDQFHENKKDIYRINFGLEDRSGGVKYLINSPPAIAPGWRGQFPELKKISRMRYTGNCMLSYQDKEFYEDHGYFADSLFLEIMKFDFEYGDPLTALDEPNSIVLTASMAEKYFDQPNPIGSVLTYNNDILLKVTGILSSVPKNSHLDFQFLLSFETYVVPAGYASDLSSWGWLGFMTYVELEKNTDPLKFENKLQAFYDEGSPEGKSIFKPKVQNLSAIYLGSNHMTDDLASHIRAGNENTIYTLMGIALLILIIASFNFSNLSNALSVNRCKSIGIRKVLGAHKSTIFWQILSESLLMSMGCLVMAYGFAIMFFPAIGKLLDWEFTLTIDHIVQSIYVMFPISFIMGMLAGIYPSIVLSYLDILNSLKSQLKIRTRNPLNFKNVLVLFQFAISIGLMSASMVISQQTEYMRNKSLGFNKENVLVVEILPEDLSRHYELFRRNLLSHADFLAVSRSERILGDPWPVSNVLRTDHDPEQAKIVHFNQVDYDYFSTIGIELKSGRTFSEDRLTDSSNAIILNQKAVEFLGIDEAIGQQVHFFSSENPLTIIGVVDDFNYSSLHQQIGPAVMVLPFIDLEYMYVRLSSGDVFTKIDLLEQIWNETAPNTPLDWKFLDDNLDQLYKSEARLSILVKIFTLLAIVLACLGLYGIVAFMIHLRIKEFGVRKVLGASIVELYLMFIKRYIYQILLALFFVIPIMHHYLNAWLQNFAYSIAISWWVYPLATGILLVITLFTVSFQTIKAARVNPAMVLKSE